MKWHIYKHVNNWVVSRRKIEPLAFAIPIFWEFQSFKDALSFVIASSSVIRTTFK